MCGQNAIISVMRRAAPPAGATPRPGMTPWSRRPSNITRRLARGKTVQPWVASAPSLTRCSVTSVGPPAPDVR